MKKGSSIAPKISKLGTEVDKYKLNKFLRGTKFKFPIEFELQIY
jgi:hypothetical protein